MTPTCNTCDTKFPGKEICKLCGSDPNAPADLNWKIAQTSAKPPVEIELKFDSRPLVEGARKMTKAFKSFTFDVRAIARVYQVPTLLVADRERLCRERARRRALVRSWESARTSQRHVKHGRVGVR